MSPRRAHRLRVTGAVLVLTVVASFPLAPALGPAAPGGGAAELSAAVLTSFGRSLEAHAAPARTFARLAALQEAVLVWSAPAAAADPEAAVTTPVAPAVSAFELPSRPPTPLRL